MPAKKNTPARRALNIASMGVDVAGSYIGYVLQRAFLGTERGKRKLRATHTHAARRMVDEMQALRGPAMKLGQTLSLQTGFLPDETLAELATLQMAAPGMHPSLVWVQIKGSLGREAEEVFKTLAADPFAAASLGQVHRAVTRDGTPVAVKVQYPGIAEAIENDFKLFRAVSKPAQASGHVPKVLIDEIQEQIIAETDYAREADNIEFFERGLAPLPFVTVPHVHREYSSDKVLTMSLLPGRHLDDFLARRPSQELRDRLGAHLFELYHFQVLKLEALHADPHWGNYLFDNDGNIGLVDFGCVKYLASRSVAYLRRIYLYPGATDSPEFSRLIERYHAPSSGTLTRAMRQALIDLSDKFYRKVYPPEARRQQQPFDFGDPAFLRDYLRGAQNLARTKGLMTDFIFMGRAEVGLYQTLHRLRARVLTSQIVRRCLEA